MTEIDLAPLEADPAASGDGDRVVVEGVGEVLESPIETGRWRVEIGGDFHGEGLVRPTAVVAVDEGIEPGLLLEHVGGGGLSRFGLQGEMHAFVPAILLRMAGLDALDVDAEAEPPDGEFAEA